VRASVVLSALVAVVVGFGGTVALIITAAEALGASAAQTSSWVTAICLGTAATTAVLSIRHRLPIMTAWSTPGAALIAATAGTVSMEAAVGAFILAGALILLTAMIRPIGTLIEKIPTALAAAMLAGVLIRFVTAISSRRRSSRPWCCRCWPCSWLRGWSVRRAR
jgi:benzoate membrane transport protein